MFVLALTFVYELLGYSLESVCCKEAIFLAKLDNSD